MGAGWLALLGGWIRRTVIAMPRSDRFQNTSGSRSGPSAAGHGPASGFALREVLKGRCLPRWWVLPFPFAQ